MKWGILFIFSLLKFVLAQPTGEIVEIPVGKSVEEILKSYSLFVGTILSVIVIAFMFVLIKIYKKRKAKKAKKQKLRSKRK